MSKKRIDELQSELQQVRQQLRDAHRTMLILYLTGAKAQRVAAEAGLDVGVDQDEIVDAIQMFENGELEIKFTEKAQ